MFELQDLFETRERKVKTQRTITTVDGHIVEVNNVQTRKVFTL